MRPASVLSFLAPALLFSMLVRGNSELQPAPLFGKRDVSNIDISSYGTALLIKNGMQTTCDVVLIDNQAGFIAANCLDYSGKDLSKTTIYEVYISKNKWQDAAKYTVDKFHVHPVYDPSTLANNIVVIEFNSADSKKWTNKIALNRAEWTSIVYVRTAMTDVAAMNWAPPQMSESDMAIDTECKDYSNIYNTNRNDYWCGNVTATSVYSKSCYIPYGSAYALVGSDLASAAIYSHTAIQGNNMCKDKRQLTYFTLLSNYVMFANNVLGRYVETYVASTSFVPNTDPRYKMKKPSSDTLSGIMQFGGNIYPQEGVTQTPAPVGAVPTASAASSSSLEGTPTVLSSTPGPLKNDSAGLTRNETIIVATVVPLASIAIIIGLFFLYKWYRRRKHEMEWDPRSERSNLNAQTIARDFDDSMTPPLLSPIPPGGYLQTPRTDRFRIASMFGPATPRLSVPPPPYMEPHMRQSVMAQPLPPMSPAANVNEKAM
ncbi:hypothetical protein GQ54DRAFT_299090 [Martensiomyces pterosporus]|nr:hypothetical protein GQ54DRAFT_299090 [Martensiomyces pterosporus]